ncbi:MAG: chromosome partitioning protein ParB [Solirubrobacteraceae bacterium]
MPRTGLNAADAQDDFLRVRRRRAMSRIAHRLRGEPGDVNVILPFEEVVAALGRTSERQLGLLVVPLDAIVGTVDRTRDFDRQFRPTTGRVRARWERIAAATRRGESMPPIDVYRIGDLHFVRDGHHRVSVARALGRHDIDAYVTEVTTRVPVDGELRVSDLLLKDHERLFGERVPLPAGAREPLRVSDPWDYSVLAEGVEAWGFRVMQDRGAFMDREQVAAEWYAREYVPVVTMLRDCGLIGPGTETDSYLRLSAERYRLMRTHQWTDEVLARLRRQPPKR